MNRIMTAFALSGLLLGAPAFAKSHHQGRRPVATAGVKAAAGDKASETKTETSTETKTDSSAKPKKVKKTKKVEKTEGSSEKPAEAPAK